MSNRRPSRIRRALLASSAVLAALPLAVVGGAPAHAATNHYAWVGTAVMPTTGSFAMPTLYQEMSAADAAQYGNLFASATPRAQRPTSVVQLGDSYASGEGTSSYGGGTGNVQQFVINSGAAASLSNTTKENSCHRATGAAIFSVTTVDQRWNLACSGAESEDIFGYNKQQDGTELPQAYQLARVATTTNVKSIVIGLGGNDVAFADILNYCVSQWIGLGQKCRYNTDDRMTYGGKSNVVAGIVTNFSISSFNGTSQRAERALDSYGAVPGARQRLVEVVSKVRSMMQTLGYADSDYTIVLEGYMSVTTSPAANASLFTSGRDPQCTFYGEDANYFAIRGVARLNAMVYDAANDLRTSYGMTNVRYLNNQKASQGAERCKKSSNYFVLNGVPLTGGNERGHPTADGHARVGACLNTTLSSASSSNWAWGCTVTTASAQPGRPAVPSFP